MRFKTLKGRERTKDFSKYRINWDKKEKSKFQTQVKDFLAPFLKNHIVYSEMPMLGTLYRMDIYDATTRICYEAAGFQHEKFTPFFQKNRLGFLQQIKRDSNKARYCEINQIKLVEISPADLPLTKQWFFDNYQIYL